MTETEAAQLVAGDHDIALSFRTRRYSDEQLQATLTQMIDELSEEAPSGAISLTVDPAHNEIVATESLPTLTKEDHRHLRDAIAEAEAPVEVERSTSPIPVDDACSFPYCDFPLRGGAAIFAPVHGGRTSQCTAGYLAVQNGTGRPHILTAGHCMPTGFISGPWFTASTLDGQFHTIGESAGRVDGEIDAGIISAAGSWWDQFRTVDGVRKGWSAEVVLWTSNNIANRTEHYRINGVYASVVNAWVCVSGGATRSHCGTSRQPAPHRRRSEMA